MFGLVELEFRLSVESALVQARFYNSKGVLNLQIMCLDFEKVDEFWAYNSKVILKSIK